MAELKPEGAGMRVCIYTHIHYTTWSETEEEDAGETLMYLFLMEKGIFAHIDQTKLKL